MTLRSLIRNLFARPANRPIRKSRARCRPALEALEVREVPAVLFVNDTAAGDNNGHDWANAFPDLQSALTAAQSGDQIWVAEGTYYPTSTTDRTASFGLKAGVSVYGGFAGSETALWQRNWREHLTTLSGDIGNPGDKSDNSYHVVVANGLTAAPVLDGFSVTGGNANGSGTLQSRGGGVLNTSALMVSNVIFTGNSAGGPAINGTGGGMDNLGGSSVLNNVIFDGNTASFSGGGMSNTEGSSSTLINVIFTGNSAGVSGGGLENDSTPEVTLNHVTFSGNTAGDYGGGMYSWPTTVVTVTNSIFWGNSASLSDPQFGVANGAVTRVSYSNVQGGAPGTGNIDADPLFVDAANGDLRLQAGSPAIDAGTNTGSPAFDIDGQVRPRDGKGLGVAITDMGAYEAKASPAFSGLLSPTIAHGTASVKLGGHLAVGSIHPPLNAVVSVTLNGVTQEAPLDADGNFSTTFNTTTLTPANYVVTYGYDGDNNFNPAAGGSILSILAGAGDTQKVTPQIVWFNPTDIVYGTKLSVVQLKAWADVPGNFDYTPAAGTLLSAGTHRLYVNFIPNDTINYTNATAYVDLTVDKATPTVTITNNNATYQDGQHHPASVTVTGVDGVTPQGILQVIYTAQDGQTTSVPPVTPGDWGVNVEFQSQDDNYRDSFASGILHILPAGVPGVPIIDGNTLVITGTPGNDVVHLARQGDSLVVFANFLPGGTMSFDGAAVKNVRIDLGDGDDFALVDSNVRLPVFMDGGAGNDTLIGGGGHDMLTGGTGDDVIRGRRGNDVLVGGSGRDGLRGGIGRDVLVSGLDSDTLEGGAGEDLLIGGVTAFDNNATVLRAVRAEWASGRDYATRVANMLGTGRGRVFLTPARPDGTVFDDSAPDVLRGQGNLDWYFASSSGDVKDIINGLGGSEKVEELIDDTTRLTPPLVTAFRLDPASDTGIPNDQNTSDTHSVFIGQVSAGFPGTVAGLRVLVQFNALHGGNLDLTPGGGGRGFVGSFDVEATSDANGTFRIQAPFLPEGFIRARILVIGQPDSPPLPGLSSAIDRAFRIDTTAPSIVAATLTPGGAPLVLSGDGVANLPALSTLSLNVLDPNNPASGALAVPPAILFPALDPAAVANISNYTLVNLDTNTDFSSFITSATFVPTEDDFVTVPAFRTNPSDPNAGRIDLTFAPGLPRGRYQFIAHTKQTVPITIGGQPVSFGGLLDAAGIPLDNTGATGSVNFVLNVNIQPER